MIIKIKNDFTVQDFGPVNKCLGINIKQQNDKLVTDQLELINIYIKHFELEHTKVTPIETGLKLTVDDNQNIDLIKQKQYRRLLNALTGTHVMKNSRSDISYAINVLNRCRQNVTLDKYQYLQSVLKYIKGAKYLKFNYKRNINSDPIKVFVDASWGDIGSLHQEY